MRPTKPVDRVRQWFHADDLGIWVHRARKQIELPVMGINTDDGRKARSERYVSALYGRCHAATDCPAPRIWAKEHEQFAQPSYAPLPCN
ncbi:MAG: hypothetical protein WKF96_02845 [Solirubrobacteraceae bacterium]